MKTILTAVLACVVGLGVGCKSRGGSDRPQPMMMCAGCHRECPTDRACPKDGKCAGCDANCKKPAPK